MEENDQCDLRVRIHSLLSEGHTIRKTADLCKCSQSYVRKIALILVDNKQLQSIGKYNQHFQVPLSIRTDPPYPPHNRTIPPNQPMFPKGIGAVFNIDGTAKIQYNLVKMAYHHEPPLFKSQWSYRKCQIWLHAGFRGKDPNEIRANARADLLAIADRLADKFGCKLTAVRWMRDEWVDFNLTRSARIANAAGLKKGARMEVAGAIHKFSDWSDPDKLQFNPTPKGNPEIPLAHAQIHHQIYSGEYERRFEILMESNERFAKNLELHLSVLQEIRDAIKELKETKK